MLLREGRLEDLPQVAKVGCDALWDDEIVQYLAPNRNKYPLCHRDHYLHRTKKRFFAGNRLVVAVTEETDDSWSGREEIAGFSYWSDTLDLSKPETMPASFLGNGIEQFLLRSESSYRWYFNIDKSFDKDRYAKFWKVLTERPFFEDISQYWELEVLAISPKFQRRGLGSLLLTWGMHQAANHNLPVVVAATLNGEHLYKKHGFSECGRIQLPDSNVTWAAMVWHPATEKDHRNHVNEI